MSHYRHVKGRVLVALADGTIAIFHRGTGRSEFEKATNIIILIYTVRCIDILSPPSRRSVGSNQLPPVGSGPTPPLNPLHDSGP